MELYTVFDYIIYNFLKHLFVIFQKLQLTDIGENEYKAFNRLNIFIKELESLIF